MSSTLTVKLGKCSTYELADVYKPLKCRSDRLNLQVRHSNRSFPHVIIWCAHNHKNMKSRTPFHCIKATNIPHSTNWVSNIGYFKENCDGNDKLSSKVPNCNSIDGIRKGGSLTREIGPLVWINRDKWVSRYWYRYSTSSYTVKTSSNALISSSRWLNGRVVSRRSGFVKVLFLKSTLGPV